MKFNAQTVTLSKLLQIVSRAVAVRSTIRVLSGVLFEAEKTDSGGKLRIAATDTEISISTGARTEVEEAGRAVIPARVLLEVVRSLPEGEITLAVADGEATLTHGKNRYEFATYPAEDFPVVPGFPKGEAESFAVPTSQLAGAVGKVLPCASRDEKRPVLTAISVDFGDGRARMVSTDSYRMAVNEQILEGVPASPAHALVPARALREVARMADLGAAFRVALKENAAVFSVSGVTLTTRLIDGNYPEYKRMLPDSFAAEFSVERGLLADSLKRINLFAARQSPPIPVRLEFSHPEGTLSGGELRLSAKGPEAGGAVETIPAEIPEGTEFSACFNPTYLLDGVQTMDDENLVFRFNRPKQPAILFSPAPQTPEMTPDDPSDAQGPDTGGEKEKVAGFRYLLMPMRDPNEGREAPQQKKAS